VAGSNGIVIEFGDARLDFGRRVLERSGKVVAIRPKSLVLLCFLATNPNRVLSKEELIEAVWGDAAVTDDNLAQTIKDVRRAIGDRSASTLRSIPRRGYLFFLDHVASVPAASVAVLPFSIAGPGPSEHWLGDGLAEDILVELSRFQSLTVIARNSSFRFRGGEPPRVCRRLQILRGWSHGEQENDPISGRAA